MNVRYAFIVSALALVAVAAWAKPGIRSSFLSTLKIRDSSKIAQAQCALCHAGRPPVRNPFGKDVEKAMDAKGVQTFNADVWKAIAKLDSDKDGATNEAEIKADTLPGDPASKPVKAPKPAKPRK